VVRRVTAREKVCLETGERENESDLPLGADVARTESGKTTSRRVPVLAGCSTQNGVRTHFERCSGNLKSLVASEFSFRETFAKKYTTE
jgi:hypothetical protein